MVFLICMTSFLYAFLPVYNTFCYLKHSKDLFHRPFFPGVR